MSKEPICVLVTGAAGQIAYSLLYQISSGYVFGADQPLRVLRPACSVRMMSGGAVREAGGAFGKKEKAAEDQYFRQQQQKQLPTHLKKSHGHGDGYGDWPFFHIGFSLFMIVLVIKDYN